MSDALGRDERHRADEAEACAAGLLLKLSEMERYSEAARNEALEEAARIPGNRGHHDMAIAIRALKVGAKCP